MALKMQAALVLLFFVSCATATIRRFSQSPEERLYDALFHESNYNPRVRPVFNPNNTVHVKLQMQVYTMLNLNERDETITISSWLTLYWHDKRLSWDPSEFDGVGEMVVDVDEMWTPKIFLSNSVSKDSLHVISGERGSVSLSSQGDVHLGTPFVLSTHCPMQVRFFPFDIQVCQFNFIPVNQLYDQMALSAEQSHNPSVLVSLQWNLLNSTVTSYLYPYYDPNTNKSTAFTGVLISLYLQRNPSYYISNIIVPSTFMCCLAFATFLAPPESGERISLGVSMVLGLTVFQLLIADTLPTSSKESPILGNYLAINFILACLVVPLSLANINIACMDKRLKILKYGWVKKVFVEWLPSYLCVSTIGGKETESIEVDSFKVTNDQGQLETKDGVGVTRLKNRVVDQPRPAIWTLDSTSTTKAHLETRTFALVMDRLFFMSFLTTFSVSAIRTIIDFSRSPGLTFTENEL